MIQMASAERPLDDAIRAIPIAWFQASRAVYWVDLLVSAGIGWTAFAFAVRAGGAKRAALLAIVIFALYRAVLFIHEITHRGARDVPGFTLAWNALVGIPLMIPSFLYEGVHLDHHRARTYGTPLDPEYVPFGRRSPLLIAAFIVGSIAAPLFFATRFAIVAPIGWLAPPIRRLASERLSALVINHEYIRRAPIGASGRVQEAAACLVVWTALGLWWAGRVPGSLFLVWLVASAAAFGINALRTLAAHRYDNDGYDGHAAGELSMTEQLLDSCTIQPNTLLRGAARTIVDGCHTLVAPVGLRYHALHHWIPSLPYHRLGRTHRLLVARLRADAPYHETIERGFVPALARLVRRASR